MNKHEGLAIQGFFNAMVLVGNKGKERLEIEIEFIAG